MHPVGSKYVYSDLNMITTMYAVGHLAQTHGMVTRADLLDICVGKLSEEDPEYFSLFFLLAPNLENLAVLLRSLCAKFCPRTCEHEKLWILASRKCLAAQHAHLEG